MNTDIISKRNIRISYLLGFINNAWFWLGIWVFYYLRFTNYAGIGIIETVLVVTHVATEIPTGAIADLLGKKNTLIASFIFQSVGNILMGLSPNFSFLIFSVIIGGIGGSLYSGTLEALVYDSLKQDGKEPTYPKVIANLNSVQLIAPAVCGIIGGLIYRVSPGLPFIILGILDLIALFTCFLLTEPKVDTIKFSLRNFISQTKYGIGELTKNVKVRYQTLLLLSLGVVIVIVDQMLDGFLSVEYGYGPALIGILWSIIYLASSLSSQFTPYILRIFGKTKLFLLIGILIAITLLISPILGLIVGGLSLIFRSSLAAVFENLASITINEHTESKYRATTISTFNMFKNIPYVALAFILGSLSDRYSAKNTAFFMGIVLIAILIAHLLFSKKKNNHQSIDQTTLTSG
ncbi:MFS transporter [Candidatus Collierbacteria bacterium]|nr:MFS transporter [Candidatus Collierbacteria bacterium]